VAQNHFTIRHDMQHTQKQTSSQIHPQNDVKISN